MRSYSRGRTIGRDRVADTGATAVPSSRPSPCQFEVAGGRAERVGNVEQSLRRDDDRVSLGDRVVESPTRVPPRSIYPPDSLDRQITRCCTPATRPDRIRRPFQCGRKIRTKREPVGRQLEKRGTIVRDHQRLTGFRGRATCRCDEIPEQQRISKTRTHTCWRAERFQWPSRN